MREFVEKCLASVSLRLSARELLQDPFLRIDDCESDLRPIECRREPDDMVPLLRQPFLEYHHSNNSFSNGYSNAVDFDARNGWGYQPLEMEPTGIELFEYHEDEHPANVDISIKGKRREDDGIFLRLRIADKEGQKIISFCHFFFFCYCLIFLPQMKHGTLSLQTTFVTSISHSTLRWIQH